MEAEASPAVPTVMLSTAMSTRKRTLLFGGTFDPVHLGHMYLLRMAGEHTDYERIIIMPARISNFKQESHPASCKERVEMLDIQLAEFKAENPGFRPEVMISRLEIDREGVSYTYDTVISVLEEFPVEGKLGFLMGDDLLSGLDHWYRFKELSHLVTFVCFTRGMHPMQNIPGAEIRFIEVEPFDSSSSEVRAGRLDNLSKGVREYVSSHGLYRTV